MDLKLSCATVLILALLCLDRASHASLRFPTLYGDLEKENSFWYKVGERELRRALGVPKNENIAKNIIFFLGDGMGITASTAGRIFKGQDQGFAGEEGTLAWETFPHVGLVKTYTVDRQVTDSAASATAYLGGVKANYKTSGVNANVQWKDCPASLNPNNRVDSILKWAQDIGKETGFITTTRLTHATPAALYAHSAARDWECDTKIFGDIGPNDCKDIARQLVEDEPGRNIKVILGGGRDPMGATLSTDGVSTCPRNDGRNLVTEWLQQKKADGFSAAYVTNNQELKQLVPEKEDYILGLFSGGHMPFVYYRDDGPLGTPPLNELTEVAIRRLQRSPNGYFLLVEGGRIDQALHETKPRLALEDLLGFDEAVDAAVRMTNRQDTLVVVTADHSHSMTLSGYPPRGNDILGTTTYEDVTDGMPYTTLMFTVGAGAIFTWDGTKVLRRNLTNVDTRDPQFTPQASVPVKPYSGAHGGEDVAIYASGPMSHLFHTLHEQAYIAHALGYASCMGPFLNNCDRANRDLKRVRARRHTYT